MTDNEIMKALECCSVAYDCPDCPFENDCGNMSNLATATIDLINRQKAEIERLKAERQEIKSTFDKVLVKVREAKELYVKDIARAKSEAYREFVERFKWYVTESGGGISTDLMYSSYGIVGMLDIVYKELTRNLHATYTELARKTMNERFHQENF